MLLDVRMGKIEELEEIANFTNFCFNKDIKARQPKLYTQKFNAAENHLVIKNEDNQLIATMALIPIPFEIYKRHLNALGIGSVCVHPDYQKHHILRKMIYACEESVFPEYDFLILSSKKVQYNKFGFSRVGLHQSYEIKQDSYLNHKFTFKPMTEERKILILCQQLYQRNPIHTKRNIEKFLTICKTWQNEPYFVFDEDRFIGYITYGERENTIIELEVTNPSFYIDVLKSFLLFRKLETVKIFIPSYDNEKRKYLEIYSRYKGDEEITYIKVMNYVPFIGCLLNFKTHYKYLMNGSIVLKIENQTIEITIDKNEVVVRNVEKRPHLQITQIESIPFLTGPFNYDLCPTQIREICKNWFPLPFYLSKNDLV